MDPSIGPTIGVCDLPPNCAGEQAPQQQCCSMTGDNLHGILLGYARQAQREAEDACHLIQEIDRLRLDRRARRTLAKLLERPAGGAR